jgi:hypothetical protein
MHSSPLLFGSEFPTAVRDGDAPILRSAPLAEAFADYHPQDRIVIVAPDWEETFVQNAAGVAALTALFYDALRATGKPFYSYPSHYLLFCQHADGIHTRRGPQAMTPAAAGKPWGHLDVWPETQWLGSAPDTSSLLRQIFALHTHRLFWPEDLPVVPAGEPLPSYLRLILASRLKAVYLYNTAEPTLRIEASPRACELLDAGPRLFAADFSPPRESRYRVIDGEAFAARVGACFAKAPPPHD